jgi:hypothetical protein
LFRLSISIAALAFAGAAAQSPDTLQNDFQSSTQSRTKTCVVQPGNSSSVDDAPVVLKAFQECGHDGRIVFLNQTYYINSVMNTTGLNNCEVDLQGTLLVIYYQVLTNAITNTQSQWSSNIHYWLNNSLPVPYQNMVSVLRSFYYFSIVLTSCKVCCLVFWRGERPLPGPWIRYSRWQWCPMGKICVRS